MARFALRGLALALGLEAVEVSGGLVVGALDGGDEALEAGEEAGLMEETVGESSVPGEIGCFVEEVEDTRPGLGFGSEKAAETPAVGDHLIDEELLAGIGGAASFGEFPGEEIEVGGVLAGDDLLDGMDAGFDGVEAGGGFAFGGAGAGRGERVSAIGGDLSGRCHKSAFLISGVARERAGFGVGGWEVIGKAGNRRWGLV